MYSQLKTKSYFAALGFIALMISFVKLKLSIGDGNFTDFCHQGEYFNALLSVLLQKEFIPISTHGALDYVPGALSISLFGMDKYLLPTEIFYIISSLLASLFLFFITLKHAISKEQIFIAGFLIPHLVTYKDLFLLSSLFVYFCLSSQKRKNENSNVLLILLGLSASINFFWSFNRGLAGLISIGVPLLYLSIKDRKNIIAVVSFLSFATLLSLTYPSLSLPHYLENIIFLKKTSYQWSYGFKKDPLILSVFIGSLLVLVNILISKNILTQKNKLLKANALLLALLSLCFFQISTSRADMGHIGMGLIAFFIVLNYWSYAQKINLETNKRFDIILIILICLIIFAWGIYYRHGYATGLIIYIFSIFHAKTESFLTKRFNNVFKKILYAILIIYLTSILFSIYKKWNNGAYEWTKRILSLPSKSQMVNSDILWVTEELLKVKSSCILDMSNNGVINALANLPTCTKFSYIVYADKNYENEIIKSIANKKPNAIVYSSNVWSYSIDNISMVTRFPELDKLLTSIYKYKKCNKDYCILYLIPQEK